MSYLSIDYLIVYAFLLITLVIGLQAGRGIKDIREYVTANKQFGTAALVLTFLSTNTGIINVVDETEKTGIILPLFIIAGTALSPLMVAILIAPKMVYLGDCITMGDIVGTLYGTNSRVIAGVVGFLTAICISGMQLIALGILCESFLNLDYRWGIGLGGYSSRLFGLWGH